MATPLVKQLQTLLPTVQILAGDDFYWSPGQKQISYHAAELREAAGQWALIHEVAHAMLKHQRYQTDYDLLLMEVAAWKQAQALAKQLGLTIDKEHIEDCLDTYRDWLHERSTCPSCGTVCLQVSPQTYHCYNCSASWKVSASRFCRPYRLRKTGLVKAVDSVVLETTFS